MKVFTALDEFYSYYEMQEPHNPGNQLMDDLLFAIKWHLLKNPEEKPFIAVNKSGQTALFSCAEVAMKKITITDKGTRIYEDSEDLPVYTRAFTFPLFNNDLSNDEFEMVIDELFQTPVDAILIYVYKQDYDRLTTMLEQKKYYKYYASCYCDAFDGEIGHNRYDRMQLILPNKLEEVFQPFHKKKQHRYNYRQVKRAQRSAENQYDVQYKLLSPLTEYSEPDIESIFSDIEFIYQNSWQSDHNLDNHKEKLTFLHQHEKLMLILVYADGIPASYFYGYVEGGNIRESWMAYNTAFSRYSFGLIALVNYIKLCIDTRIQSIEFGGTTHQYKTDLVNIKEPIHEIIVFNPKSSVSRKLKLIKSCYPKALI